MNHNADECYSKHGFPPWMKQRHKTNVNYVEAQQNPLRNQEGDQIDSVESKQTIPSQSLTSEQVQRLLRILQNSKEKIGQVNTIGDIKPVENEKGKFNPFWILDTGATGHVTCLKNMFINFRKITPLKIGLPNGTYVHAHYASPIN